MKFRILILFLIFLFAGQYSRADEMKKGDRIVVTFGADWCKWCKVLQSQMEKNEELVKLLAQYDAVRIYDNLPDKYMEMWKIKALPTTIIMDIGENKDATEVARTEGVNIKSMLEQHIKSNEKTPEKTPKKKRRPIQEDRPQPKPDPPQQPIQPYGGGGC